MFSLLLALQLPCPDSVAAVTPASLPWVAVVEHIGCERIRLADVIAVGHGRLRERAEREAPALLPRIEAEPPRPRPTGYGLLPELTADPVASPPALNESRYSIQALLVAAAAERRAAAHWAARTVGDTAAIEPLVGELERLKRQLRWLESSVTYHRFWQKAGEDSRAFFDRRNELVLQARALDALLRSRADTALSGVVRRALAAELAPFAATPGLRARREPDGSLVLPVTVITDIADSAFLAAFEAAVAREWNQSPAAQAARFLVELTVERVTAESLYPEGPPAVGASIVEAEHLRRFPAGALVLTTGGRSTHAWVGRYIQLGTAAIGPRVLAHEFGHLLGFSDGYLRGTEGAGTDPFGYVFVEWTGIQDDLMGAPSRGRVSHDMIDRILAAYAPGGA